MVQHVIEFEAIVQNAAIKGDDTFVYLISKGPVHVVAPATLRAGEIVKIHVVGPAQIVATKEAGEL